VATVTNTGSIESLMKCNRPDARHSAKLRDLAPGMAAKTVTGPLSRAMEITATVVLIIIV
jgi:hypothetical protein